MNGLIVWKTWKEQLSPEMATEEALNLENEGFEVIAVKNSHTIILAVTSEGLAYSTARLQKIGVMWERKIQTHNQLRSIANQKLAELKEETR